MISLSNLGSLWGAEASSFHRSVMRFQGCVLTAPGDEGADFSGRVESRRFRTFAVGDQLEARVREHVPLCHEIKALCARCIILPQMRWNGYLDNVLDDANRTIHRGINEPQLVGKLREVLGNFPPRIVLMLRLCVRVKRSPRCPSYRDQRSQQVVEIFQPVVCVPVFQPSVAGRYPQSIDEFVHQLLPQSHRSHHHRGAFIAPGNWDYRHFDERALITRSGSDRALHPLILPHPDPLAIFHVVSTERDRRIRTISARDATRHERRRYEEAR